MNMISTGAFLPEMDASNKQETMAEKFAQVWEKKNSKVARAGGVSLMALSLAACGSSSTTTTTTTPTTPTTPAEPTTPTVSAKEVELTDGDLAGGEPDRLSGDDFSSTADTITATSATIENTDVILEGNAGDADVMNVTLTAANAAFVVAGVENINVNLNVFNSGEFVATNVSGSTITVSSEKLGFDGEATVSNLGDNAAVAGTGITDLIVTGIEAGIVDAGSADTAALTHGGTADDEVISATVNGDIDLTATFSGAGDTETLLINATAASEVTLNTGSTIAPANLTLTGTGDITLDVDADDITGGTVSGVALVVSAVGAGALDAENITASSISVTDATAFAITNANGQSVSADVADAALTVSGDGETGAAVTVSVTEDQTGAGATLTVDGVDTSTINIAEVADFTMTLLTVEGEATINVVSDAIFDDIAQTAATDSLVLAGDAGDVTISETDIDTINSSALAGALSLTSTQTADVDVTAGDGDTDIVLSAITEETVAVALGNGTNSVTVAALDEGTVVVTGGTGDDTVSVGGDGDIGTAAGDSIVALELGAGDDAVTFGGINGTNQGVTATVDLGSGDNSVTIGSVGTSASSYTIVAGTGEDTVVLTAGEDYSGETLALTGVDIIDIDSGVTLAGAVVDGEEFSFLGDGSATLAIVGAGGATDETIDLSGLTFDQSLANAVTTVTVDVTGGAEDTITTSHIADEITVDGGDTVVVDGSTVTFTDTIIGFATGSDVLNVGIDGNALNTTIVDTAANNNATLALAAADVAFAADTDLAIYVSVDDTATTDQSFVVVDTDGDNEGDMVFILDNTAVAAVTDIAAADFVA